MTANNSATARFGYTTGAKASDNGYLQASARQTELRSSSVVTILTFDRLTMGVQLQHKYS